MLIIDANFGNAVLELIQSLGYTHLYGPDIPCDYRNPIYEDDLLPALEKINPGKTAPPITEAAT